MDKGKKGDRYDISGQRFGQLTAVSPTSQRKDGSVVWYCTCDCGRDAFVSAHSLKTGNTKSCGCLLDKAKRLRAKDLTGMHFGRLTAIAPSEQRKNGCVVWRCQCNCEKECFVPSGALLSGKTHSCGCSRRENNVFQRTLDYVDGTCIQFIQNTDTVNVRSRSGYRGVSQVHGKWQARIAFKKKNYYLGTFANIEDAVKARKRAEEELFEPFLKQYTENCSRQED